MRRIVADASVLVRATVPQPGSDPASRALAGGELLAPDIALAECANALWKHVRSGQCALDEALEFLAAIVSAEIDFQASAALLPRALELATLIGHPVYDCLYLTLAAVEEAPVLTADARLARAAERAGLEHLVALVGDS